MLKQVHLLMADGSEFPSEPFTISARSCQWDSLLAGLKSSAHVWHKLPGGAQAAYERVSKWPAEFSTPLIKASGGGWTFKKMVCGSHVSVSEMALNML
jgi:hypothetical protein